MDFSYPTKWSLLRPLDTLSFLKNKVEILCLGPLFCIFLSPLQKVTKKSLLEVLFLRVGSSTLSPSPTISKCYVNFHPHETPSSQSATQAEQIPRVAILHSRGPPDQDCPAVL